MSLSSLAAVLVLAGGAWGQSGPAGAPTPAPVAATPAQPTPARAIRTGIPQRDTLLRLMRPITVDFQEKRLEDVMTFIKDFSGADIEPLWADERQADGLDKEQTVSVRVDNGTALSLIERVLDKARGDFGAGAPTWQMTDSGTMQIGPKERLNRYKRVEIYDINDLLLEVPNYPEVPLIDLQQALQAAQGGSGGGQSPFREEGGETQQEREQDRQARADELVRLITGLVDTEQWVDNGGSGGTIRYYRGTIIVNAPDYMHRGINGYKYWPGTATQTSMVQGRRYVTLTTDQGLARVVGFGQAPVSAVAGGEVISSNPPPGGGR